MTDPKILVYGAGVVGSIYAASLFEAGVDVALLARGERLAAVREHGVLLAAGDSPAVRRVPVPVVDHPDNGYDLILVFVRTHQMDAVLDSLAGLDGDVLFLLNWAAGADPLSSVIGRERVLLGFPAQGGTMDGEVVRYRPSSLLTRFVRVPVGLPDGGVTPRLERVVRTLRAVGINAKTESRMDAWLTTHAAFEVPLGQAVHAAGGLEQLASDPGAIREMVRRIRHNLGAMPTPPVPRAFTLLRTLPEAMLVSVFRRFLRSSVASPLGTTDAAAVAELDRLTEQLAARAKAER
ncbi:MAG: 2-dehydropantoate 2-reductase N-terminal domain-containing protein [Actinomycetota bacterium]